MEAVGFVASVGSLVALGLQVCKGLTEYYNAYRSAESDVRDLCDEVDRFTRTLLSFQNALRNSRIAEDPATDVMGLIESSKRKVEDLDVELKDLLKSRTEDRRMRRMVSRTKRALYPFQTSTLSKLRDNVFKANEILQLAGTSILISQNHAIQNTIDVFYAKEDAKQIIRWLDPPDSTYSHVHALTKRREETGSWLLNNGKFTEWKVSRNSVFWIQGNAGCGKTVLCATVIDHLTRHCETLPNAAIAYFYFDFNNQSIAQDHSHLLRSLIEQISSQNGDIPKSLTALYDRCRKGTIQPMVPDLVKVFKALISDLASVYLVIDAVDECKDKSDFIAFLNTLVSWKQPQLHIMAFSRTYLDTELRNRRWECTTITVEEHLVDADVKRHVLATLASDESLSIWVPAHEELIATTLIEGANGNFRWVACQIEALRKCDTLAELEETLKCLPSTLEDTYERALSTIDERKKEGIRNVLRWLSFAARPIRLEEIAEVMAIDFSAEPRPVYDHRRRLANPQKFFQTYSSLVHVLTVTNVRGSYRELRLAHLSVRDFLISDKIRRSSVSYYGIDPLSAHTSIAQTCLVYLRQFDKPLSLSPNSIKHYALARYAAKHWPLHVQAVVGAAETLVPVPTFQLSNFSNIDQSTPVIALIVELLLLILKVLQPSSTSTQVKNLPTDLNFLCTELLSAQDTQLQSQIRFYDPDTPWIDQPDISRTLTQIPSALYYASSAGLVESVKLLIAKGIDVNSTGGHYGSALQAACCKGFAGVVQVLLTNGANVNQVGGDYGTALQGASSYGHADCVNLLLEHGADVNIISGEHTSALHAAAFNGHSDIVTILLDRGAHIDTLDDEHRTPLIWAAGEGHHKAVQILLERGSDCMIQDQGGWTALDESAPPGHDSIVQLLIKHHLPIIHSKDKQNFTALHHTSSQCHDSTTRILLEHGMDVDAREDFGHTSLFHAARSGHIETVNVLLEYNANLSLVNGSGWSALHVAAFYGHTDIVAALIDHGADLVEGGREGITPLHVAALMARVEIVALLLNYGADIRIHNDTGHRPIDYTYYQGNYHDKRSILFGIESPNRTITGLRIAAAEGRNARIRKLLECGADINAKDDGGISALLQAFQAGHYSTAKLLIENGADVNVQSDWGSTPMSFISHSHRDEEMQALLIEHGYDPLIAEKGNDCDDDQHTAMEEIRELLMQHINDFETTSDDTTLAGSEDPYELSDEGTL